MSRLTRKPMRIGKYAVPALLLLALAIGTVAAVAYVVLQFTTTATVVANPKVCFIKWADGTKANTFDYAVNIFPTIKTIDSNITYGIWNWDSASHSCALWIKDITSPANIQRVYIKVYDGGTLVEITWNTGDPLPQSPTSFTAAPLTEYTMHMEITATSGATGSSVITVDMKVEQP